MTPATLIEEAANICRGKVTRDDKRFFRAHPGRHYWLRYASPVEVAARKYIERGAPVLPDVHVCVLVVRTHPARLARYFVYMDIAVGPPPVTEAEEFGRECYEHVIRGMNHVAAVPLGRLH